MKHRIQRLEKAAALRLPPKVKRPELKIYTKNISFYGAESWEGGKAPVEGENNLILTIVETRRPDGQNGTDSNTL